MVDHQYKTLKVDSLIPYVNNARTHSPEQVKQIESSILEFGFTNPVLVDEKGMIIAGHGRIEAAKNLSIDEVPCIELVGLSEAQKKAYILADNKLALSSGWDTDKLKLELEHLNELDFDLSLTGFDSIFTDELMPDNPAADSTLESESTYTANIDAPTYEPKNEKPDICFLTDKVKTDELIKKIKAIDVTLEEKAFLIDAAERHTVFNFSNIADYYAHSSPEMKDLMEDSALVIIDYNKALENGFIKIKQQFMEQYNEE